MADVSNFFARWSRLKRHARKPQALANEAGAKDASALPESAPTELPQLESLTVDSDYTAFMQPGVADATRNAALQKLWRSDPVFANLDGLVEYGEDYASLFKASAVVRTVYRVAQGLTGHDPPMQEADQPAPPLAESAATRVESRPQSGAEPPSEPDQPAKDGDDTHTGHAQEWTDA